ncbi:acyl-CoA dehydrogenase family protein [Cytobacillus oceanisediminis]|nr:acyl-CoA dehydrogenase family protein [Cytobacillus oceanisediminis]
MCEEVERGDSGLRRAVWVESGVKSMSVVEWGNEEEKEKYLVGE